MFDSCDSMMFHGSVEELHQCRSSSKAEFRNTVTSLNLLASMKAIDFWMFSLRFSVMVAHANRNEQILLKRNTASVRFRWIQCFTVSMYGLKLKHRVQIEESVFTLARTGSHWTVLNEQWGNWTQRTWDSSSEKWLWELAHSSKTNNMLIRTRTSFWSDANLTCSAQSVIVGIFLWLDPWFAFCLLNSSVIYGFAHCPELVTCIEHSIVWLIHACWYIICHRQRFD